MVGRPVVDDHDLQVGADHRFEFASQRMHRGVDLITLGEDGLIETFEVVMRPHKTIGALRDAMMARIGRDPRFLKYRTALG